MGDDDTPRDARYNAVFCDEEGKARVAELALDLQQREFRAKRWEAADELGNLGLTVGILGSKAFAEALQDHDADAFLRFQSSKTLAGLGPVAGDTGARALARTLLKNGLNPNEEENDICLRSCAASSLGKLTGDAGQVGVLALGRAVEMDPNPVVRRQAAASLGEIGHDTGVRAAERAAVPGLIKALQDSDLTVRWRAAESVGALGALAGDAGAAALAKALREDADVGTRRRAAEALGQLGETAGSNSSALVHALRNDTYAIVRTQAQDSIIRVRDASVFALSSSEHDYIRGRAAWAIGELGELVGDEAIGELLKALFHEPEVYVRRRVLEAVGKIGKPLGEVGAAALARARDVDSDAFVSCNARFIYDELGIELTEGGMQALDKMLANDIRRPAREAEGRVAEPVQEVAVASMSEEGTGARFSEYYQANFRSTGAVEGVARQLFGEATVASALH